MRSEQKFYNDIGILRDRTRAATIWQAHNITIYTYTGTEIACVPRVSYLNYFNIGNNSKPRGLYSPRVLSADGQLPGATTFRRVIQYGQPEHGAVCRQIPLLYESAT